MIKQSITITERNKDWLDAQVSSGRFGNISEVIRDLIREREGAAARDIAEIRKALKAGRDSGVSPISNENRLEWIKAQLQT